MSRNLEAAKIIKSLEESKVINLDSTLRDVLSTSMSREISALDSDEPWWNICYTQVAAVFRGNVTPIEEILPVLESVQERLSLVEKQISARNI